jgi:hypothetical protein
MRIRQKTVIEQMDEGMAFTPKFSRAWAMPNSETFKIKPIRDFVLRYLERSTTSIDPFARNAALAIFSNDLNPRTIAATHMEAGAFIEHLSIKGIKADLILMDPPYSPRQTKECYNQIGIRMRKSDALSSVRAAWKSAISRIIAPRGVVLWFGWNSAGMGKKYGFTLEEILLVCHGGDHNDTICIAERFTQ